MPAHSYDTYSNVPAKHPYETLRVLQTYDTQFVVAVQPPSREHSETDYPIKRLHYASPSFTRRQYKRASVYLESYDDARLVRNVQVPGETGIRVPSFLMKFTRRVFTIAM